MESILTGLLACTLQFEKRYTERLDSGGFWVENGLKMGVHLGRGYCVIKLPEKGPPSQCPAHAWVIVSAQQLMNESTNK